MVSLLEVKLGYLPTMAVFTLTSYLPPSLHEHSLSYLLILFCSYLIIGSIYRLYFHPLARVPGPKLAALTLWYEFYHDFIRKGKYLWVIGDMHAKYGMSLPTYAKNFG